MVDGVRRGVDGLSALQKVLRAGQNQGYRFQTFELGRAGRTRPERSEVTEWEADGRTQRPRLPLTRATTRRLPGECWCFGWPLSPAVRRCRPQTHAQTERQGNEAAAFVPRRRVQRIATADKMRAMHDGLPEDVAAALSRLESGLSGAPASPAAWEPRTPLEAVKAWVTALGLKPGAYLAPPMARLGVAFEGHAREHGWALDSLPGSRLGPCLRQLGFRVVPRGGVRGALVTRENARLLWGGVTRTQLPKRVVTHKPPAPVRSGAPLFWESLANGKRRARAMPLVDTLGRVWPSARVAESLLRRVNRTDIHACATGRRGGTGGCLWRYLTPDELASIPPMQVSGHVLPSLAWPGPIAGRAEVTGCCPTCGRRQDGEG